MASLSTVYGLTIVLGSLAAMGAAYIGSYVYKPTPTPVPVSAPAPVVTSVEPVPTPAPQPVSAPENTEQTLPTTA